MAAEISALTDGVTAIGTDRLPGARSPFGTSDNVYVTPDYIRAYMLALANTWAAKQTITPAVNTEGLSISSYSLTGANAQSALDISGTWNTSGTPNALKINITNTASNVLAGLVEAQLGGVTQFRVGRGASGYSMLWLRPSGAPTASNCTIASTAGSTYFQSANNNDAAYFGDPAGAMFKVQNVSSINTLNMVAAAKFGWTSAAIDNALDVILARDAAGVLAQRNGTNAQSLRIYYAFTDLSNRQNAAVNTGSDYVQLAAETAGTGALNLDVRLTPAGTGNVRFGTHADIGIKVVTGSIVIKDAGGTLRELAVVS